MVANLLFLLVATVLCAPIPPEWQQREAAGHMLISTQQNDTYPTSVGNGYLATNAGSDTIYVSGVFNGKGTSGPSHRARIQSLSSIFVSGDKISFVASAIDLEYGIFYARYSHALFPDVVIELQTYAHQTKRYLLVNELRVSSTSTQTPIWLDLSVNSGKESPDFSGDSKTFGSIRVWNGTILETEEPNSPKVTVNMANTLLPDRLEVIPHPSHTQVFPFLTVIRTSLDSSKPFEDVLTTFRDYDNDTSTLRDEHVVAWVAIWQNRIEFSGPGSLALAQAVNASLYYLLTSIRDDWYHSLSPGSLSSNAYNGHTFWDAETWMYPPILLLHPGRAESMLQYRYNNLAGARAKAKTYNPPYDGAMFPWESAFTGQEVCPSWAPTGEFEQHITGDIAFAIQQFYQLTGNVKWLKNIGFPMLEEIGKFWVSRVDEEPGNLYGIRNVIPPDEYHQGNNSVYTNVVAAMSLNFAAQAGGILGISTPTIWGKIASNMKIPFDKVNGIHLEFDEYKGDKIKQADVVLLGFPLMYKMDLTTRKNDLVYYEQRTDPEGPAMTWGMHAVAWLELKDYQKAHDNFIRSYANIHKPYNVWLETPTGGATNFITGAGGFLQGVMNGYGGIRLDATALRFEEPTLPQGITEVTFRNVFYQQNRVSVTYNSTHFGISADGPARLEAQVLITPPPPPRRLSKNPIYFPLPNTILVSNPK